uniref:Uncharacterized protein n=1 Tax=Ditylenchus dipsaci TaxID=166011 RepID=A0A915D3Q4_9BILA
MEGNTMGLIKHVNTPKEYADKLGELEYKQNMPSGSSDQEPMRWLEFSTKVAMWIQEEAASIDEPTSNVIDSEDVRSPTHKRHKDSTSFSLHADTYEDVRDELLISSAAEIVMVAYSSVFSGNGDPLEFWKGLESLYK